MPSWSVFFVIRGGKPLRMTCTGLASELATSHFDHVHLWLFLSRDNGGSNDSYYTATLIPSQEERMFKKCGEREACLVTEAHACDRRPVIFISVGVQVVAQPHLTAPMLMRNSLPKM